MTRLTLSRQSKNDKEDKKMLLILHNQDVSKDAAYISHIKNISVTDDSITIEADETKVSYDNVARHIRAKGFNVRLFGRMITLRQVRSLCSTNLRAKTNKNIINVKTYYISHVAHGFPCFDRTSRASLDGAYIA